MLTDQEFQKQLLNLSTLVMDFTVTRHLRRCHSPSLHMSLFLRNLNMVTYKLKQPSHEPCNIFTSFMKGKS